MRIIDWISDVCSSDLGPAPLLKVGIEPGLISHERVPSPVRGNALAPTHDMFGHDALIWDDLNSRRLKWGAPGHPLLDIAFPDTPWLGLWQKTDVGRASCRDMVCQEV